MTATAPKAQLAIRNVLIATDFSSCSERALLHAVAAAHHFGSTLHLVHVVQPALFSIFPQEGYMGTAQAEDIAMDLARADAQKLVSEVLRRTHCEDLKYSTSVQLGEVGETVRALIRREHIDLAVVGTHGKTGLRRLILGSAAEDIFRYATCPVLTVGPHSWRSEPQSVRLQHVLFPSDLSADSAHALPFVMAMAAEFDASLTILHVIERLDAEASHDRSRVTAVLKERMYEMASAAGPLPQKIGYEVKCGDVANCVIETAADLAVDLVAFGLKAPDSYADRLPWMHAYKIVCEVGCPVLSLRGTSNRE